MALTLYNIKKWTRMLTGHSVMHVCQDLGKAIRTDEIYGYYNNLTAKVTMLPELLDTEELPLYHTPSGEDVTFPVDVFQYGLGAYDLWLLTGDCQYLTKFQQCVAWTLDHQEASGAWCTFFFKYPDYPYGAMAQGEAVSLLMRAYRQQPDARYLEAARRALDYMLQPLPHGVTIYEREEVLLSEYQHLPVVMNGWIFAWWGLYDFVLTTDDHSIYRQRMEQSERSLRHYLPRFATSYWSQYDVAGHLASPFYHRLHIAQMQAMYLLTREQAYADYAARWERNLHHPIYKGWAFVRKAWQKINEKEQWSK